MDDIVKRLMESRREVNELGEPLVPRCTFGKRKSRKIEEKSKPKVIDTYINKKDRTTRTRVKNDMREYPIGTYIRYATKGPINDASEYVYGIVKVAEDTWVSYSNAEGYGEVESSDSQALRKMIDREAKTIGIKFPKSITKDDVDESIDDRGMSDIKSRLESQIRAKVRDYMSSIGFEDDEIDDYSVVELREDDGRLVVEVRAELSYRSMTKLASILDPIIQRYGDDAYFDMEDAGIMTAYLDEF